MTHEDQCERCENSVAEYLVESSEPEIFKPMRVCRACARAATDLHLWVTPLEALSA